MWLSLIKKGGAEVFYFAILNEDNICITTVVYHQELENVPDNYIPIEAGQDVIWCRYENGAWSEEKYEPEPVEPIPTLEEITAQTLLNTEYLVILSEIENS